MNEIDFGTNIEILPPIKKINKIPELKIQYLDEIYMQPIPKFKNVKQSLKGFDIIRMKKPKQTNITGYLEESQIIQSTDVKLKNKTKINNIIETTNNIFIPPKKKEPFTWDTFFGQELSILSKKRKYDNIIDFLEGFDILRTPKPENEIQFSDTIEIIPEPKEPYEIFFGDELYIPEKVNKLKATPKPKNKVEHRDRIKLLGKTRGKNILQKVTLVEIYGLERNIQYEENDYLFIPGIEKPENIIEANDYIEILPEPIKPLEFICEPCDFINIISLDKPKNEKQSLESFDIFRTPRPANIMEQINPIFIEATPRDVFFEVEFGDEIFIEKVLKPENKAQRLKGFNILKKPKPLNSIQKRDKIAILPKHIKPLKLICQKSDLFTINRILKPVNKMQRLGGFGIIKKFIKAGNKLYKSDSFYILRQPKALNYIENTANINLLGIDKNNDLEIVFGDEIFIEEKERPINRMQRIQEIKILKKSKPNNLKQKITNFQFLKKIKPKNTIQKRDNIYLYSNIKQNKEIFLDIEFGDEIFIEKIPKPENKAQRLKGFNILKKTKPVNSIQIRDEIQILPKIIKPLKLMNKKGDINKLQKLVEFMIKPNIKQMKNKDSYSNNTIVDTANFQIISVSIRELYQQRLQGFVIYKKEKEPNEIEKNYDFIIRKEYDALLARPLWNDLDMQNEYLSYDEGGKEYYKKCSYFISNCKTCTSNNVCTSCFDGYGIVDNNQNDCILLQDKYYYDSTLNTYKLCSHKNPGCKACSNIGTNDIICKECDSAANYVLIYDILNYCKLQSDLTNDKSIFLDSKTLKYFSCSDSRYHSVKNCNTCHNKDKCDTCQNGYEMANSNELCISYSDINQNIYYKNTLDNRYYLCSNVIKGCEICENLEKCIHCYIGFDLDEDDKCIPTALAMTRYYLNNETGKYVSCSKIENCEECISSTECTGCKKGYELDNSS